MSYGIPGVEHSSTIMHFSHTEAAVTTINLHSLLQEHLQQLQGSAIDVLVLVLNDDFMEAQFCLYSLHQKWFIQVHEGLREILAESSGPLLPLEVSFTHAKDGDR